MVIMYSCQLGVLCTMLILKRPKKLKEETLSFLNFEIEIQEQENMCKHIQSSLVSPVIFYENSNL